MSDNNWIPATHADLVPGAVFVVRGNHRHHGTRVVLYDNDNSGMPWFRRDDGELFDGENKKFPFFLTQLERIHPPADTIPVPRDVAWEFVRTHNTDGCWATSGSRPSREELLAAILSADPGLLDEPSARVEPLPAMTPELLAALRDWHSCVFSYSTRGQREQELIDAIERAGIVQPRPTPDEIEAARVVIERAGMKVTS